MLLWPDLQREAGRPSRSRCRTPAARCRRRGAATGTSSWRGASTRTGAGAAKNVSDGGPAPGIPGEGRRPVRQGESRPISQTAAHVIFRCNDPTRMAARRRSTTRMGDEPPPPTTRKFRHVGTTGCASWPLVDKRLFSFKAFAARRLGRRPRLPEPRLRGSTPDAEVSAAFGEFRLSGCRNIVTARAARRRFETRTLPLAPKDTRFDYMWFEGVGRSASSRRQPARAISDRSPASSRGQRPRVRSFDGLPTVASMKANSIDIEVFRRTPSAVSPAGAASGPAVQRRSPVLLHGSRTHVDGDLDRLLGPSVRPDLTHWTVGDLATVWTADYFGALSDRRPSTTPRPTPRSFVVLKRGADGRRTAATGGARSICAQTSRRHASAPAVLDDPAVSLRAVPPPLHLRLPHDSRSRRSFAGCCRSTRRNGTRDDLRRLRSDSGTRPGADQRRSTRSTSGTTALTRSTTGSCSFTSRCSIADR